MLASLILPRHLSWLIDLGLGGLGAHRGGAGRVPFGAQGGGVSDIFANTTGGLFGLTIVDAPLRERKTVEYQVMGRTMAVAVSLGLT